VTSSIRTRGKGLLSKLLIIIESILFTYRHNIFYENDLESIIETKPKIQINTKQATLAQMGKLAEKSAEERGVNKAEYMARLLRRLKRGDWCFVAERNDDIAGYAWVAFRDLYLMEMDAWVKLGGDEAVIYDVYTFLGYRGMGVATKIIEIAIRQLIKNDYKRVYASILRENRPSRKAFEKLNFYPAGSITFFKIFGVIRLTPLKAFSSKTTAHVFANSYAQFSERKSKILERRVNRREEIEAQMKEVVARDREAHIYDLQYNQYRKSIEIPFTLRDFEVEKSNLVLDAGAGTGRFTTEFVKRGAEVVAVDYSLESIKINKLRCNSNVICADICYLPFKSSVFDKVASIGVFQHVPTWQSRFAGLEEILRVSKKRAKFLVSVYNYRLKIGGTDRQGYHSQGLIQYYRFFFSQFKSMLCQVFPRILELRGTLALTYVMERLYSRRSKKLVTIFEYLIEKTFLSFIISDRLVAICET